MDGITAYIGLVGRAPATLEKRIPINNGHSMMKHNVKPTNSEAPGCAGLGSILAVVLSWSVNKSILWAIIHGCFGWLYVIYYLLCK